MNEIDNIIARIRQAIADGEAPRCLALRAGLGKNTLYGYEKDDWNPSANTLRILADLLPPT